MDGTKKKKDKKSSGKEEKPKKKKKKEEATEVWKWWEEEPLPEGVKWKFLEHKGPVFAPLYEPIPPKIKFFYNGMKLFALDRTFSIIYTYISVLD